MNNYQPPTNNNEELNEFFLELFQHITKLHEEIQRLNKKLENLKADV